MVRGLRWANQLLNRRIHHHGGEVLLLSVSTDGYAPGSTLVDNMEVLRPIGFGIHPELPTSRTPYGGPYDSRYWRGKPDT